MSDGRFAGANVSPGDEYEIKARHIRALFREHRPAAEFTDQGKLVIDQVQQADQ
jgi:hypothetical protein